MKKHPTILLSGGAGYVGAVLVPKLLAAGYQVRVLDWFLYGKSVFGSNADNPNLTLIPGDIRDLPLLEDALRGCDSVIHLACVSNDPSFELDPNLSRSVNFDAFEPLVAASKIAGVSRFIYASSSSVYGVSDQPEVTEDHPLVPLTDYNRFKGMCEPILLDYGSDTFETLIIRPATVCGYSPRQRLDLTVNILTAHAYLNGLITVFGGQQMRPNIHIEDMTDLYIQLLKESRNRIDGKTFNAGYQNYKVMDIALMVQAEIQAQFPEREFNIKVTPSDDNRSYHISSKYLEKQLGFKPKHSIADAVSDLLKAFRANEYTDPLSNPLYSNVKMMKIALEQSDPTICAATPELNATP